MAEIESYSRNRTCLEGHRLKKIVTEKDGYSCQICQQLIPEGSTCHWCKTCSWNVCAKCFLPPDPTNQAIDEESRGKAKCLKAEYDRIEKEMTDLNARGDFQEPNKIPEDFIDYNSS